MSNRKKLKAHNGATRITPMAGGLYCVQCYNVKATRWEDVDGLHSLTWEEAQTGRHNYVTLRDACKVANKGVIKLHVPNEGNGN